MKGVHHITIQNKRVRYDFDIRRNITVIRGDSATGKTTLIDMVREYIDNGAASSVDLRCDKKCYVLEGATWEGQLSVMHDSIVFIDEGNPFVYSHDFARTIQDTDNYYVIVSRESLYNLPYSVEEVYGIHSSGRYGRLRQVYHEFHRMYGDDVIIDPVRPEIVVVEDSNSGYQFFNVICDDADIKCVSAEGKGKIHKAVAATGEEVTVIIADGAAFGPEMDRVTKYLKNRSYIKLYLPESFEWLLLSSGLIDEPEIRQILESPSKYIDSSKYFSWEQFFTSLIVSKTQDSYMRYSKAKLNESYLSPHSRQRVLTVIDKIDFTSKDK